MANAARPVVRPSDRLPQIVCPPARRPQRFGARTKGALPHPGSTFSCRLIRHMPTHQRRPHPPRQLIPQKRRVCPWLLSTPRFNKPQVFHIDDGQIRHPPPPPAAPPPDQARPPARRSPWPAPSQAAHWPRSPISRSATTALQAPVRPRRCLIEGQQFLIVIDGGVVGADRIDGAVEQTRADRVAVALSSQRWVRSGSASRSSRCPSRSGGRG